MHYHWGQAAGKKRNMATLNSAHKAKKQCNFDSGWLERQQCDLHSSESCEPKRFVRCWNKVEKKKNSRTTTKSGPLLQPEHGFCQQNGPERGQVSVSEVKNDGGSRLSE